ncbi:hypothetical protein ACFVR1_10385 [Psychrobacillus sp. NPDC058041]
MELFNLIKNERAFWLVDQVKIESKSEEDYKEAFIASAFYRMLTLIR